MAPFRNILVPLDGSELAEKALEPANQAAMAMAQYGNEPRPVRLTLLCVVIWQDITFGRTPRMDQH